MKKAELKQNLKNRKGYFTQGKLKKGINWLANHYQVTPEFVQGIVNELKEEFELLQGIKKPIIVDALIEKQITPQQINKIFDNKITEPGTYYVTGCVHAPFHNKKMYDATFNYIKKEITDLKGVILNGDIIDANSLSFHDKGNIPIKGVTLEWEYKEANKFMDQVDELLATTSVLKTPYKYFIYGNHEDRYNRLINTVDASKYGRALKSPEEGLKLYQRDYKVLTNWKDDVVHIGKYLDIVHGEFCNVHSAKKTIDTYRKSTLYNHTHRFQIFMEGQVAGFNMGWGGDINAPVFKYATRAMKTSWINSSALVTLDKDGFYHVQPLVFINDKLIINGKEY